METVEPISLADIRTELVRLEETIIFALIERSQFGHNISVYKPGVIIPDSHFSFLDYFFRETEKVHARMRRFTAPDEFPFYPDDVAQPAIPSIATLTRPYLPVKTVNVNNKLKEYYIDNVLNRLCEDVDDTQYGSCTISDIAVLQAISKRVHLGLYVAEAKIQQQEHEFRKLVEVGDKNGVNELLTNVEVERKLLERVQKKVSSYAVEITDAGVQAGEKGYKINPDIVVDLYSDWIIPMTKEVEVEYIFKRLQSQ